MAENYTSCYDILQRRYNNKREIFDTLFDSITDLPKQHSERYTSLKQLHDTTYENIMAIRNLKIETKNWDPMLIRLLTKKLSKETLTQFECNLTDVREIPTFDHFMNFIEKRFLALQSTETKNKSMNTKNASAKCAFCDSNHSIVKCEEFLKKPVSERFQIVKNKKLCNNCLKQHDKNECTSTYTCKTCKKNHNTLLHFEKSSTNLAQIMDTEEEIQCEPINALLSSNNKQTLLATAIVGANTINGETIALKALIDQGSQNAFISQNAAQLLGLKTFKISIVINGIGQSSQSASKAMTMSIKPRFVSDFSIQFDAIILPKLAKLSKSSINHKSYEHLGRLVLADPSFNDTQSIDIILGAAEFAQIIKNGLIKGKRNEPIAQNTELGWIISGETHEICKAGKTVVSMISNIELDTKINTFFENNEFEENCTLNEEEKMCEKHYEESHARLSSGKYVVRIPFKNNMHLPSLGDSRKKALATFFHLEKRFERNAKLKTEYIKFINEYISLGHMQLADKTNNLVYYLPHHAVLRDDSTTTKLRVVFNASQKTMNGLSLNEQMAMGPLLQNDLITIILNWRIFKYVFTADIEKMYRQINIADDQQDLQRIIWRESPNLPLSEYKLKTITYGTANAPYLAIRTLFQLASDENIGYPRACEVIKNCFYVDDVMHGAHDINELIEIYNELRAVMSNAGMNLRKWTANSDAFLNMIPESDRELTFNNNTVKALGLRWNPITDNLKYKVNFSQPKQSYTKRQLLSEMSSLFDPLGFISPVLIAAKSIFQLLWLEKMEWDDDITAYYSEKWNRIRNELNLLNELEIPRWIFTSTNSKPELIGFCDASTTAYAAVVYVRTIYNNEVRISLLMSKARVAPMNEKKMGVITIPKLELCSALLLARLIRFIGNTIRTKFDETYLYSDSKVALAWIAGNPNKWKVSVSNKVTKINSLVSGDLWQHVPGELNPADIASRGAIPSVLASNKLWWNGPHQLLFTNKLSPNVEKFETTEEAKPNKIVVLTASTEKFDIPVVSSYSKLKRIIAYVLIFASKCRKIKRGNDITIADLQLAEISIIKIAQREEFHGELQQLHKNQCVGTKSRIIQLTPFLDSKGIMRVGGRLKNATVPYDAKHQILLPSSNIISSLIIEEYHRMCLHGGPRLTESLIRQKFWLTGSRNKINHHVHKCIVCFKNKPTIMNQLMADLPAARVNDNIKPFTNCAIDNTGEMVTKFNKGKGAKTVKSYATIFVCMSTKAIRIELVSDLTAEAFIAALRRFVARRGNCKTIHSDNATCFVKANKLLQNKSEMEAEEYNKNIRDELLRLNIEWKFSPPAAPHFNGLAEAAVKSIKYHLKRVIGSTLLTYEEMSTLLCQIEACANSRPICAVSSNPNDVMPLTPGHFLVGQPLLSVPEENLLEAKVNWLTRWQLIQRMQQHFWKRWREEYLNLLQSRKKWRSEKEEPKENDLVLIKDENTPPNKWPMAKIIKLHRGHDGLIRVVTLKTENNELKRPIAKICLLPIDKTRNITENSGVKTPKTGNNIPIITALFAMVLTGSLIVGSNAMKPFNITSVKNPLGLYFEEKSDALLTKSDWNIYCYLDYEQFQCEFDCIKTHISSMQKLYNRIKPEICLDLGKQLDSHVRSIEGRSEIIMGYRQTRVKRSIWKTLDDALQLGLGSFQTQLNSKYIESLRNISYNTEQMTMLNKRQASMIETTANILIQTNNNLTDQTQQIEKILNYTMKMNNSEQTFQPLLSISLKLHEMLIQFETKQNNLINLISDSHINIATSILITPKQLNQQMEIIRRNIDSSHSFLVEDAHELYKIMHIKPLISMDTIIFRITIPIFSNVKYKIYKTIPIPINRGNESLWIQVDNPYLLVSMDHQFYQIMSESEYLNCIVFADNNLACNGLNHLIPSTIQNCEFSIFRQ